MLQRAASNAYSWWWASHIRTKQSKWLEQSLQDMEEKVTNVVKLIDEDGDSFAKRAEMYYKKRPELIHFVEESYRAYRALAERYDHISKELQNANSTLASAFPDQFQFPEDDDDDYDMPRVLKKFQKVPNPNIPKAPQKFPTKNIKAIMAFASNKKQAKPVPKSGVNGMNVPKSGLSKDEALGEIDKLQKEILTLQTEKEFAKSSYERGHAKYWEIDGDITERQEKISKLQDEFGINKAIEDDEARNLMTEAALKSCHNTLAQLQKKQEKAVAEARAERQKIKDARVKLLSLKGEILEDSAGQADASEREEENQVSVDDGVDGDKEQDLELLSEKIKEHFDVGSCTSLSVSAMAEKVDELVNKVINLETAVSSQTALIQRLRSETDELQEQIKSLEDDKANLIDGKNTLSDKLKEMENKLKELQDLDCDVKDHINHLQTSFTAAHLNLGHLSEKLHDVKPDDEIEESGEEDERKETNRVRESIDAINRLGINAGEQDVTASVLPHDGIEGEKIGKETDTNSFIPKDGVTVDKASHKASQTETNVEPTSLFINNDVASSRETSQRENEQDSLRDIQEQQSAFVTENDPNVPSNIQPAEQPKEQDEPDWQQLFVKGLEGKEKVLLDEYTSILRNFKDVKKKLNELEKKSEDNLSELTLQMKELRNSNAVKDEEIQSLRQKLIHLQKRLDEHKTSKENKDTDPAAPTDEPLLSSSDKDDYESMKLMVIDQPREVSPVEEKLRADIDEILEENLDFWLRFSTSFGQIQKFQTGVKDLLAELAKLQENEKKKREGSVSSNLKSDVRPIYKHLREIQTELTVWVEQSVKLKDELQRRFSQLCHIQEKITRALNAGAEDEDMKFTSFQAAKFQGEVANMQQENNKVADELQAGMDHVTSLQLEVESTITRLDEDFGFSATRSNSDGMKSSQGRIPLRSFIFGVKPKKHKQSIFSCMHPSMMQKK